MNTKYATALVIATAALGAASSSFAFGTSSDNGVWSGNTQAAVAINPNGDTLSQPSFHSTASRAQVSNDSAQNREQLSAVAANPQGPMLVAQPTFHTEHSRAEVRQEVAQNRQVLTAIATNPNGDDALMQSIAQRRVTVQRHRAALVVDGSTRISRQ